MKTAAALIAALILMTAPAHSSWTGKARPTQKDILSQVKVDQNLGKEISLNLSFADEQGKPLELASLFHGRPVILNFVYYKCPMLCGLVLQGLSRTLRALPFRMGSDFDIITVSFDPKDTPVMASARKEKVLADLGKSGRAGAWHFLTGTDEAVRALTNEAGFRYAYDEETGQFAHAAVFLVLTPEGKISRYFHGVEFSARDLRLAIVEASGGRIGTWTDQVLLYCYHYDPTTGRYTLRVMGLLRVLGWLTALIVGGGIAALFWSERRSRPKAPEKKR